MQKSQVWCRHFGTSGTCIELGMHSSSKICVRSSRRNRNVNIARSIHSTSKSFRISSNSQFWSVSLGMIRLSNSNFLIEYEVLDSNFGSEFWEDGREGIYENEKRKNVEICGLAYIWLACLSRCLMLFSLSLVSFRWKGAHGTRTRRYGATWAFVSFAMIACDSRRAMACMAFCAAMKEQRERERWMRQTGLTVDKQFRSTPFRTQSTKTLCRAPLLTKTEIDGQPKEYAADFATFQSDAWYYLVFRHWADEGRMSEQALQLLRHLFRRLADKVCMSGGDKERTHGRKIWPSK